MKVSELKPEVNQPADDLLQRLNARFDQIDMRFAELTKQIADEGEKTRRHFDVVAAEMNRNEISSWISPWEPARNSIV